MKLVFMLLPLTLALLACTDADMTADGNACKSPADRRASWQIVTPGVWSTGPVIIPRKSRPAGLAPDGPGARACVRHEDCQTIPPRKYDLQKIGQARSGPITN
jgi:hypothetical protein